MSGIGKVLASCLLLVVVAVQPASAVQGTLDELARDVDRTESMRAVKNLQRTYAQYSQYGLWNEMSDLFARESTYIFDDETIKGRKAIGDYLISHEGLGKQDSSRVPCMPRSSTIPSSICPSMANPQKAAGMASLC